MKQTLFCGDFFCGSGGGTTGMIQAASELGLSLDVLAVNHWPTKQIGNAIEVNMARALCREMLKGYAK